MAGSMATRSPRLGPSAITPAPSWPSTSGCASVASPIAPSSHQCRSEPQIPTAVTRTRLIPAPAAGSGSSPTRRSPTAWSLAARTTSPDCRPLFLFYTERSVVRAPGHAKTSDPRRREAGITGAGWCGPLGGRTARQGHGRGLGLAGLVHPGDRDRVAGVVLDQGVRDILGRVDRLAADRGDRVALGQAGVGRGGAGDGPGDAHAAGAALAALAALAAVAALAAEPAKAAEAVRAVRAVRAAEAAEPVRTAEPAEAVRAAARAVAARGADLQTEEGGGADVHVSGGGARLDLLGDGHRLVDRDRVRLGGGGGRGLALSLVAGAGGGVHPDHLAVGVDQRTARVAGLDGRVGLDQPGQLLADVG